MKVRKIIEGNREALYKEAAETIARGGMVIYPTETCYGIGVDATNDAAVKKLLEYKGGRQNKAVSVAVASLEAAKQYVEVNEIAEHLYREFLPGPVTVVSYSLGIVSKAIVSERNTLGIRIPDLPFTLTLLKELKTPLTATSANTSGKKTPYSLEDLRRYTSQAKLEMIDLFLDAGTLPPRPPSTVVDTTLNQITTLRAGSINFDEYKTQEVTSHSEMETIALGKRLMEDVENLLASEPVILAIQGQLGAGKTQLVKGVAQALGIKETVVSPTYQIVREYPHTCGKVSGKLVHIDTWRLDSPEELVDLDVDKLFVPGNVIAIEWMEKLGDLISEWRKKYPIIWVDIRGEGDEQRQIRYFTTSF
jgi:L-threonylcarbamoyladenylate synthase